MGLTTRDSEGSLASSPSSLYSEDGLRSEVNSVESQVHHPSYVQPDKDGIPRETGQYFKLSSSTILPLKTDEDSDTGASEWMVIDYRFETLEEAEKRRRHPASRASVKNATAVISGLGMHATQSYIQAPVEEIASRNTDRGLVGRLSQEEKWTAGFADIETGPRPPTPQRRRPRITNIGSNSSLTARNMAGLIDSVRTIPRVVEPTGAMGFSSQILRGMSIESDLPDLSSSRNQNHCSDIQHALSGCACATSFSVVPADFGHEVSGHPRDHSKKTFRRQGNANWRDGMTRGHLMQAVPGPVSAAETSADAGDQAAGYCSGDFVTNLQCSPSQVEQQMKGRLRCLFCL